MKVLGLNPRPIFPIYLLDVDSFGILRLFRLQLRYKGSDPASIPAKQFCEQGLKVLGLEPRPRSLFALLMLTLRSLVSISFVASIQGKRSSFNTSKADPREKRDESHGNKPKAPETLLALLMLKFWVLASILFMASIKEQQSCLNTSKAGGTNSWQTDRQTNHSKIESKKFRNY